MASHHLRTGRTTHARRLRFREGACSLRTPRSQINCKSDIIAVTAISAGIGIFVSSVFIFIAQIKGWRIQLCDLRVHKTVNCVFIQKKIIIKAFTYSEAIVGAVCFRQILCRPVEGRRAGHGAALCLLFRPASRNHAAGKAFTPGADCGCPAGDDVESHRRAPARWRHSTTRAFRSFRIFSLQECTARNGS